ncbi:MAG: hypothetical protein ACI8W7_000702 [Gammaproteobacteria bacterium]|jgi:hypothetical protein
MVWRPLSSQRLPRSRMYFECDGLMPHLREGPTKSSLVCLLSAQALLMNAHNLSLRNCLAQTCCASSNGLLLAPPTKVKAEGRCLHQ